MERYEQLSKLECEDCGINADLLMIWDNLWENSVYLCRDCLEKRKKELNKELDNE